MYQFGKYTTLFSSTMSIFFHHPLSFFLYFAKLSSFPFTQDFWSCYLEENIKHIEIGTRNFACNQTKRIVTSLTCTLHEDRQTLPVLSVLPVRYTQLQVSWYGTVFTAVVDTVRPLLGSRQNCQAILYLLEVCCLWQCDAASLYQLALIYCVDC